MPYVPLDQTVVLWDERGRPYWASVDGRSRSYIPPIVAAQYRDDPQMLEWARSQGFELQRDPEGNITGMNQAQGAGAAGNRPLDFRTGRQWNSQKGEYETKFDWGDVATLGAGALVGGGIAAAVGGAGAGGAAGGVLPSTAGPGAGAIYGPAAITSGGASAGVPIAAGGAAGAAGAVTPIVSGGAGATTGVPVTGAGVGEISATTAPVGNVPITAGPVAQAASGGGNAGAGGASIWNKLLTSKNVRDAIGAFGSGATQEAANRASNRGTEIDARIAGEYLRQTGESDLYRALLDREQQKETAARDAWKRTQHANYLQNYQPSGLNLSPFSRPIQGPSAEMRAQAADPAMRAELAKRVDYSYDPYGGEDPRSIRTSPEFQNTLEGLYKPGVWEKIFGWAGPIATYLGGRK